MAPLQARIIEFEGHQVIAVRELLQFKNRAVSLVLRFHCGLKSRWNELISATVASMFGMTDVREIHLNDKATM